MGLDIDPVVLVPHGEKRSHRWTRKKKNAVSHRHNALVALLAALEGGRAVSYPHRLRFGWPRARVARAKRLCARCQACDLFLLPRRRRERRAVFSRCALAQVRPAAAFSRPWRAIATRFLGACVNGAPSGRRACGCWRRTGNLFSVKQTLDLLAQAALDNGCVLALFGHTHIPCCQWQGGVLLFNPRRAPPRAMGRCGNRGKRGKLAGSCGRCRPENACRGTKNRAACRQHGNGRGFGYDGPVPGAHAAKGVSIRGDCPGRRPPE